MYVLVDTPVWSLALRRKPGHLSERETGLTERLADLIRDGRVQLIGVVRQELLSGIREEDQFQNLKKYLRAFDDPPVGRDDYEEAARLHNRCRARGIAGSAIDFLICAVALRNHWLIFTLDHDFEHYAKALGIKLYGAN